MKILDLFGRKKRDDLLHSAMHGDIDSVRQILSQGTDVNTRNARGETALLLALRNEQELAALTLITVGADVNAASEGSWTPLMSASIHGSEALIAALLERGADINASTQGGQTALQAAAINGHNECVRLLVEQGASLTEASDFFGYTPLMFAVGNCDLLTIQFLIDRGSNVNTKSEDDRMTALRLVEQRGRTDIIVLLKQAGAKE